MKRQGDVQIIKVDAMPSEAKKIDRDWLFQGEVTGHAHRIDAGELFETREGKLYWKLSAPGKVTHEEHGTVIVEPGIYEVSQKRQYNPQGGWSSVKD